MNVIQATPHNQARELHVEISDIKTGRRKVDLHLPANLAAVALRSGARLLPPGYDPAALLAALKNGTALDIDVIDEPNGERIVIGVQ